MHFLSLGEGKKAKKLCLEGFRCVSFKLKKKKSALPEPFLPQPSLETEKIKAGAL